MDTLEAFVSALPKVELHVHLVGSASVETVLTLARRHPEVGVPTIAEGLRKFYVFSDFPHFLDVYRVVSRLLSTPEDIAELVRGIGRDLGFSPAELAGLAANGVRASFLDEPAKEALLAEIAAVPLP
jgi:aminodeoxyfutalosine deaminase